MTPATRPALFLPAAIRMTAPANAAAPAGLFVPAMIPVAAAARLMFAAAPRVVPETAATPMAAAAPARPALVRADRLAMREYARRVVPLIAVIRLAAMMVVEGLAPLLVCRD